MNTDFKKEAEARVSRLLNETPEDELLRLIEAAEEGGFNLCNLPVFCAITSASTFSATFPSVAMGALDFPIFSFSSRVEAEQAANYEDLALAA